MDKDLELNLEELDQVNGGISLAMAESYLKRKIADLKEQGFDINEVIRKINVLVTQTKALSEMYTLQDIKNIVTMIWDSL